MSQEMPKFDPQEDGVNIVFPERTVEMKGDPDENMLALRQLFAIGEEKGLQRARGHHAQPGFKLNHRNHVWVNESCD